jgi:hypothetical protein
MVRVGTGVYARPEGQPTSSPAATNKLVTFLNLARLIKQEPWVAEKTISNTDRV